MSEQLTVYRASAGSGKTFTLTIEYLTRILRSAHNTYKNVLAVTFTNKATGEMKERILLHLYGIAHGLPSSQAYLSELKKRTGLDTETLRTRAGEAVRLVVHDYSNFRVETIDSFFRQLLSDVAYELHLPSNMHININDEYVRNAAVDRLLLQLSPNTPLFKWVMSFIYERIDGDEKWDIARTLKSFADVLSQESFQLQEEELREFLKDDDALYRYRDTLLQIKENTLKSLHDKATAFDEALRGRAVEYSDFSYGKELGGYVMRAIDGTLFDENKRLDISNSRVYKSFIATDDATTWLKKDDREDPYLCEVVATLQPMLTGLEKLRQEVLIKYITAEEILAYLHQLRLLDAINQNIMSINAEQNNFLLSKVNIFLNRLNGNSDASFVFEKAGNRFHHIMIDEFQDTSRLQWNNFKNLMIENMASGHDSMLVGDVKQSIYRFRNGDWTILQNIKDEVKHFAPAIKNLDTNYRSEYEIITFNNAFFHTALSVLEENHKGKPYEGIAAAIYDDVAQKVSESKDARRSGYVRVELVQSNDEATVEEQIMQGLEDTIYNLLERGVKPCDIAILVRANKETPQIINYFASAQPSWTFISGEAFLLSSSIAVGMIVAALRYFLYGDMVALAYIIKGMGEKTDADLMFINERGEEYLPEKFLHLKSVFAQLPLYETIERIISSLRLNERVGEEAYLFGLLDEVLKLLQNGSTDAEAFLKHWDENLQNKSILAGGSDGIVITTIHKSKGLEYDTVLIPFCHWDLVKRGFNSNQLWLKPSPEDVPFNKLPIVPVKQSAKLEHTIFAKDYDNNLFMERIDNLNALYVAFTRASCNLFVWSKIKANKSLENASALPDVGRLVEAFVKEKTDEAVYEAGSIYIKGETSYQNSENRLSPSFEKIEPTFHTFQSRIKFVQSNASQNFTSQPEDTDTDRMRYIAQGRLKHRILSEISTITDLAPTIDRFEREGYISDNEQKAEIHASLISGFDNSLAASWFDGSWTLYRECSIVTKDENGNYTKKIPDRVMKKGDETVVVDFKFAKPLPEHHAQVRQYMQLLQQMGTPTPPKGYLWYVNQNQIEKVD